MSTVAQRPPAALAPTAALQARAGSENFTVASRLLRRDQREHLLALYGFARLADELGDELAGDRLAALDWLEAELDRAYEGRATHPMLRRVQRTIAACRLPRDPFARLIAANRADQRVARYPTWASLRGYCHLSADPVGELVLHIFGSATPVRVTLSDSICTALQLIEHCQDVAEDAARGRIYMPLDELERFGVAAGDLRASAASAGVRDLIGFQAARARELLRDGTPLIGALRGRARFAVAAFAGGGHATLDAIAARRFDVLAGPPRATKAARVAATLRILREARR